MANTPQTFEEALREVEDLRVRLEEAEEGIEAIRSGGVDALVVMGDEGEQIYTLSGAERTYRILVEAMNEGALVLSSEGDIIYCNRTFAAMLGTPIYETLGHSIYEFVADADVEAVRYMLAQASTQTGRREVGLKHSGMKTVPTFISVANLETDEGLSVSAVVTDLTEHKRTEAELEKYREHLEELVAERTRELALANEELAESEQRTISILESSNDAFIAIDQDWRFSYINAAAQRNIYGRVGRDREELIGKDIWLEFPELRDTAVYESYSRAMFERVPVSFEFYYAALDTWYGMSVYPYEEGICAYIQDITARKWAEEALRESENRFRALVTASSQVVYRMSADWSEMRNLRGGNFLTDTVTPNPNWIEEYIPTDDQPQVIEVINEAIWNKSIFELEHRVMRADGTVGWTHSRAVPLLDSNGDIVEWFGFASDITERKQAEQRQRDALERELHITEMLQGTLVPQDIPREMYGCRIDVKYQPASREAEVGGDFYDVFDLGEGRIGVLIGDVAGKGLRAAVRVAEARYSIRSYAYENPSPARAMTLANEVLCKGVFDEGSMLTAFFAVVDTNSHTVTYSNAAHEPPVVLGLDCSWQELKDTGLPLGVMAGVKYTEHAYDLKAGDKMVMVTDGIPEARAEGVVLFEKRGVIDYLVDHCHASTGKLAGGLVGAATEHAGGSLQDDAAVVVFSANQEARKE